MLRQNGSLDSHTHSFSLRACTNSQNGGSRWNTRLATNGEIRIVTAFQHADQVIAPGPHFVFNKLFSQGASFVFSCNLPSTEPLLSVIFLKYARILVLDRLKLMSTTEHSAVELLFGFIMKNLSFCQVKTPCYASSKNKKFWKIKLKFKKFYILLPPPLSFKFCLLEKTSTFWNSIQILDRS